MGCCSSVEASHQDLGKLRDQEIDEQIKKDRHKMGNEVKLLLLGAGESGKSTLLKQMRIIHEGGFPDEEKLSYREVVFSNMIESMRIIIEEMIKLKISIDDPDNEDAFDLINSLPEQVECSYDLPEEICSAMRDLWQDEGVKACYKRRNEYQLNDTAAYYFDAMDRIFDPDFAPNDQDILCARVKTTGITETRFTVGELTYRMVDVGGQRSERKKWIHCFEEVTAIIFMVAISEYDQVLFEDEKVNRMGESITLFQSICDMPWFKKTSTILFMNKTDIFKKKLKKSPLKDYFPDYKGGDNYETACRFLMEQFQQITIKHADKRIYTHFTCATDTKQIRFVMSAVNDIIIQSTLRDVGLL
ncbi:guanine nucleotide binding protein, alpha subunit [Backusella circina FSU 941]|nr:guanine nucleotide binding protein, alpha subunit [Backusella circina FSU 941]